VKKVSKKKALLRVEKFFMDWKRSLATVSIVTFLVEYFLIYNIVTEVIYVSSTIGWGIGYRIPQEAYSKIKRRIRK